MWAKIRAFKQKNLDVIDGLKSKIIREKLIIPDKEQI